MNNAHNWKLNRSHLAVVATLVALLLLTLVAYAADGLDGTMRVTRTLKAGAAECYRDVSNVTAGEEIMVLARNADGSWLFIWAEDGDGWGPASSVNAIGNVMSLPVWTDRFVGATCEQVDARICGRDGSATSASTTRWTDIYTTADPDAVSGNHYPPNSAVTIQGRDFWGCWVSVTGGGKSGWIPVNALNERGVMGLPVLIDNSNGCSIDDGAVSCPTP